MPPVDKAMKRDAKRKKARDAKFQGVRYSSLRQGESLVAFVTQQKTTVEGKPPKRRKSKRRF